MPTTLPAEITEATKETSFKVLGNCEMCEKRIEGAIGKMKGISLADWNFETQILKIYYDEHTVNPDNVKSKLAKLGHDSETHKATDRAYNKLHDCCQYDRESK